MTTRFSKYIVAIIVLGISFSCSVKFPRAISENPMGPLTGKATKTTYLGIISVGDETSIELAAKNGNIKYITSVDYQYTDILGIIGTQSVIVSGSNEAPSAPEVTPSQVVEKLAEKPAPKSAEMSSGKSIEKTIVETGNQIAEAVNETEVQLSKSIKNKSVNTTSASSNTTANTTKNYSINEEVKPNEAVVTRNSSTTVAKERSEERVSEEATPSARKIKGFSVKAKSMSELASKIKSMSNEYMQYGDLNPIDIKLNVNTLSFSCNFMTKDTGFIKLGLYYGPKNTGCESCENVLNNNVGSVIVNQGISNIFAYQLIAIYSK